MPFTPCVSKNYWEMAAGIPLATRGDKSFYTQVLQQYPPELLKVPICSGGKFYSPASIPPSLWATAKYSSVKSQLRYYLQRFSDKMGKQLFCGRKIDLVKLGGDYNPLVNGVIQSIEPDHPELNSDMVIAVQNAPKSSNWHIRLARSLLFYWQVWHWVMSGRLTTEGAEKLHEDIMLD